MSGIHGHQLSRGGDMLAANNLGDLADAGAARTNLGLGDTATLNRAALREVPDAAGEPAGRALLTTGAGYTWQALAAGGDMLAANNLSDLTNAATARTNLGLADTATIPRASLREVPNAAGVTAGRVLASNGAGGVHFIEPATTAIVLPTVPTAQWDPGYDSSDFDGTFVALNGDISPLMRRGRQVMHASNGGYADAGSYTDGDGWSWCCAFRPDALVGVQAVFGARTGGGAPDGAVVLRIRSDGTVEAQFGDDTNYTQSRTDAAHVSAGAWVAVGLVHRPGVAAVEIYVNGALVASSQIVAGAVNAAGGPRELRFFTQGDSGVNDFTGPIGHVGRYDADLAQAAMEAVTQSLADRFT